MGTVLVCLVNNGVRIIYPMFYFQINNSDPIIHNDTSKRKDQ